MHLSQNRAIPSIKTVGGRIVTPKLCYIITSIHKDVTARKTLTVRSDSTQFKIAKHWPFCGQIAKNSGKKRGNYVFPVKTNAFKEDIRGSE